MNLYRIVYEAYNSRGKYRGSKLVCVEIRGYSPIDARARVYPKVFYDQDGSFPEWEILTNRKVAEVLTAKGRKKYDIYIAPGEVWQGLRNGGYGIPA